jgi:hypothetical protein
MEEWRCSVHFVYLSVRWRRVAIFHSPLPFTLKENPAGKDWIRR